MSEMKTEQKSVNEVILRGTIVRKYKPEKGNWLVTSIITSSEQGVRDNPGVFWFGEMVDVVDKAFDVGSHVSVNAYIRTRKGFRSQTIVGVDINDTPRELEEKFGVKNEGRFLKDQNEVLISGELVRVFAPDYEGEGSAFAIATLKTVVDGQTNFPQVTCFARQKDKIIECKTGDFVCMIGHVQTNRKIVEDKPVHYQSVVAHYIKDAPTGAKEAEEEKT